MVEHFPSTEAISLPITQADRDLALQFAQQQPNPAKVRQVRDNTLAVLVVQQYLHLMAVETVLTGDAWNPIARLGADVADLEIVGLGRLECRPVAGDVMPIPREVWGDRVGYVAVRLGEDGRLGEILGFTPKATREMFPMAQLQSLEAFLAHIQQQPQLYTDLSQWVQGAIAAAWQTLDGMLQPELAFRGGELAGIAQGKVVMVGGVSIVLGVTVRSLDESRRQIQVQVAGQSAVLPPNLEVIVFDQEGEAFESVRSRDDDDSMQIEFVGRLGEGFSVAIELGENSVSEAFVI
jgi:hypothetical protein